MPVMSPLCAARSSNEFGALLFGPLGTSEAPHVTGPRPDQGRGPRARGADVNQLLRQPVRDLQEEGVVRVQIEQLAVVALPGLTRSGIVEAGAPVLPDEEQRRSRAILPPHHAVAAQLRDLEGQQLGWR